MSHYTLEDNIPIPGRKAPVLGLMETLRTMKVGQSFVIKMGARPTVYNAASKLKIKVYTQDEGEATIRVWRTQ